LSWRQKNFHWREKVQAGCTSRFCNRENHRIAERLSSQLPQFNQSGYWQNPGRDIMSHIDYALYESPVGYALFQVVHQSDAVGLKLKETQAAANDLAKFGKMVKLTNFSPFRYVFVGMFARCNFWPFCSPVLE
jgi:hypothetical protein